jgi:hypothetical protein
LRSLIIAGTAIISLLGGASVASAETRLLEVPYRYLVIPPMEAGSKRIAKGDIAFEFPLRWESAAVLSRDLEVSAEDRQKTFKQGQALVESRLQFTDSGFARARSFCAPRLADPLTKPGGFLLNNLLGRAIMRSATDGQFCIIDRDGDGTAEYSVLVNAGSPAAREPRQIAPVAYDLTPSAVVSEGDSMKVRYRGGRSFELQIVEQGHMRLFQTFEYQDQGGHHRFVRLYSAQKVAEGIYETGAPGITFKVSNPSSDSTVIEWPKTDRPAIVPVPDDVKIHYGYGY